MEINWKLKNYRFLRIICVLFSIESIGTLLIYLIMPREPTNHLLLGHSLTRSIIILGLVIISSLFLLFTYHYHRKKLWTVGKIENWVNIIRRKNLLWVFRTILFVIIGFGILVLIHWILFPSDQQIVGYLKRATPVVCYVIVGCVQLLITSFILIKGKRFDWFRLSILTLGLVVLISWLFVGEYILVNQYDSGYFIREQLGNTYFRLMPFILFFTLLFVQIPWIQYWENNHPIKFYSNAFFLLVFFLSGAVFLASASDHASLVNTDVKHSDQIAYLEFTQMVLESDFTDTGLRNQMPGYPYLLGFICKKNLTQESLFTCGKQTNIVITLISLVVILLLSSRIFSPDITINLTLIIAFSLFIFKAGYFTVEVLYYLLNFLGFTLLSRLILKTSYRASLAAGLILGMAQMLKASILPGLIIFMISFLGYQIYATIFSKNKNKPKIQIKNIGGVLLNLVLVIIGFIGIIFPYIRESNARYGEYFYNVNSSVFFWFDSWDDVRKLQDPQKFGFGQPDLPPSEIPNAQNYLNDHDVEQIFDRITSGLIHQLAYLRNLYSEFNYLVIYTLVLVIFLILNRDRSWALIRQFLPLIIFNALFFGCYLLLYAWYTPLAGGPRFIYGLLLPYFYSIFTAIYGLAKGPAVIVGSRQIQQPQILRFVNSLVLALLTSDIFIIITKTLPNGYFGS